MNKSLLCLLLLFHCSIDLFPQSSFELLISNTYDEMPFDVFETDDGSYLITTISRNTYYDPYYTRFLKISPGGVVVDSTELINPEGDCIMYNLLRTGDNSMVAIGEWKHPGFNSELCYVGLDTSLNILWEKRYDIPGDWVLHLRSCLSTSQKIISGASVAYFPNMSPGNLIFIECSLMGDSVFSQAYDLNVAARLADLCKISDSYIAIAEGIPAYQGFRILTLDTLFNIQRNDSIPYRFHTPLTLKIRFDSLFYLTGKYYHYSQSDLAIELLNDTFQLLTFSYAGDEVMEDYGGFDQSMDISSADTVFTAGTKNMDIYHPYYSSFDSWYFLNNYDSVLDLRWTKYYGGDAYYVLRNVIATSDGGALLSGSRYDDQNPDNLLDIYIIKVDPEGLITNISNEEVMLPVSAIVCPNPGSDYLIIESGPQIAGATFTMTDIRGRTVLQATLSQRSIRLSTAGLSPGVYPWNVTYQNKIVESGKWTLSK